VAASLIGFAGNEIVALFRINVGNEIGSAALIADGHHARIDGLTSLAVFFGAVGVYLGLPLADPFVGLAITVAILRIVWSSGKEVFTRAIDGIDPAIPHEIRDTAGHTEGVKDVTEVRVRWIGHRLHAEVNVATDPELSVEAGHVLCKRGAAPAPASPCLSLECRGTRRSAQCIWRSTSLCEWTRLRRLNPAPA